MRTTQERGGPEIWLRGPLPVPEAAPGRLSAGVPEPPAAGPRLFSWLAAHGGAGATTLATVYGGHDCGRDWPGPADPPSVLLVARTHATGLESALRALGMFRRREAPPGLGLGPAADGSLSLVAVVLVADAPGRLPRPLAERLRTIESAVEVHRVPWVPEWRLGDLSGAPPRETEALARLTEVRR